MVDKIIIEVPEICESCFFFKQYLYCSLDAGILFTDNGVRGLEPSDKCPGPGKYRMTLEKIEDEPEPEPEPQQAKYYCQDCGIETDPPLLFCKDCDIPLADKNAAHYERIAKLREADE